MANFLEKRSRSSISNLKIRDPEIKKNTFRPIKHLDYYVKPPKGITREFKESLSLKFCPEARRKARLVGGRPLEDLDLTMKNIQNFLEARGTRAASVAPEIIHQVNKFENLNDLDKPPTFDDGKDTKQRRTKRRPRARKRVKDTIFTQFGFAPTGISETIS